MCNIFSCLFLCFYFLSTFSIKIHWQISQHSFGLQFLKHIFISDDSFDPSDFLGLPQVQSSVKMEQESAQMQGLQNAEFMPPPPVSNMSDLAPNDTFKQDLLQTAIELGGHTSQMQDNQMMMQQNQDQIMMQHHQQMMEQQNQEEMMLQQQQNQEQMLMQQHQEQEQIMMRQQQDQPNLMEQHMNIHPPSENTAPINQDIHDDLAISDSDDEDGKPQPPPSAMKTQENEDDDGGLWF